MAIELFQKKTIVEAVHVTEEVFWDYVKRGRYIFNELPFNCTAYNPETNEIDKKGSYIYVLDYRRGVKITAYIGDWIIRDKSVSLDFTVYTDEEFKKQFTPIAK